MRTHRKHSALCWWREREQLADLAHLQHLTAVRIEPIVRGLRGGALMDVVFSGGDRIAVVPFVEIVPEMLQQREMSPFVWPHEPAQAIGSERTDAIEDALLPWLESLTLARQLNSEAIRVFGDAKAGDLFAFARSNGFLGAAPYAEVLSDVAPYVYAMRFAQNARTAVRDSRGAYGSSLLSRHALEVRADLGSEELHENARRWFGKDHFGAFEQRATDLSICRAVPERIDANVRIVLDGEQEGGTNVEVATPVPTDVMLSFDPQDSPVCARFSVYVRSAPGLRTGSLKHAPQAAGSSSGRILLLMRDDYSRAPDGDTDEATALATMLRAEGFTVDVAGASGAAVTAYDAVHAFNVTRANELAAPLAAAQSAGIPIVLTPYMQDVSAQGAWGTGIVRALLRISADETDLEDNLTMLGQRRLEGPGLSAKRQEPFAGYDAAVRTVLGYAGAILVSCDREEQLVRTFGYTGSISAAPPCIYAHDAARFDAAAGTGEFVLVHAPLEARSNVLLLIRAAAAARLPVVVAGPVVEPEYAAAVREQAGDRTVFLPEPSAQEAEALYRRARVYADVSWVPFGAARAVRAAASGAALVVAKGSVVPGLVGPDGVWEPDPASQSSIALALGDAWMHARERRESIDAASRKAAALADPRRALVAAVQAYASAQRARTLA